MDRFLDAADALQAAQTGLDRKFPVRRFNQNNGVLAALEERAVLLSALAQRRPGLLALRSFARDTDSVPKIPQIRVQLDDAVACVFKAG